ncbi:MAG: TetR/AcrR family transcriptional regulator [Pseudomonadota bacterium]
MTEVAQADRRIQKTLNALREAFFELVLSHSYDEIKVSDIIEKADVGRSTFYQHYKSKDELLAVSLHYPLTVLVQSADINEDELIKLMAHFWENRRFAPRIFAGNARRQVVIALTNLHVSSLEKHCKQQGINPKIPTSMAAHQLAEAQLVVVIDWLLGKGSCSNETMAKHLVDITKAMRKALLSK